jgi:hypothetical protein
MEGGFKLLLILSLGRGTILPVLRKEI